MAEYIEREAVKRALADSDVVPKSKADNRPVTDKIIDDISAADVEPVRHGKWIPIGERKLFRLYGEFDVPQSETKMEYSCSTDGCWVQTTYRYPFCPMCGAKMDGGDEANENRKSD